MEDPRDDRPGGDEPGEERQIDAGRLTLEPQTAAHAREMFGVLSDPAIYEFENRPPRSEAWLRERYARLETRRSPDGGQRWLNWVIRLPSGALAGYVQATVHASGAALVAYELGSAHWGQGLARVAVAAMMDELQRAHGVHTFVAVLKAANARSARLLVRLGFVDATAEETVRWGADADERVMCRPAGPAAPRA